MYWMLCVVTTDLRTAQYFISSQSMVEPVMQLHAAICNFITHDKAAAEFKLDYEFDIMFEQNIADHFTAFIEKFTLVKKTMAQKKAERRKRSKPRG